MSALQISDQDLERLVGETAGLATSYWRSINSRPAYPNTSGEQTVELFARPWAEEGIRSRDIAGFRGDR